MSTRSLTHIKNETGMTLTTMYRQSDGYPSGHGAELAEFLSGWRIVNGLSGDRMKVANGAGCLAAFIIARFKDGPGQIYIYEPDATGVGEEYVYVVKASPEKPIVMEIQDGDGKPLCSGTPEYVLTAIPTCETRN